MRTLALPKAAEPWSLTSLREKLIKMGAKVVSHGRYVTFQNGRGRGVAIDVRRHPVVDCPAAGAVGSSMRDQREQMPATGKGEGMSGCKQSGAFQRWAPLKSPASITFARDDGVQPLHQVFKSAIN